MLEIGDNSVRLLLGEEELKLLKPNEIDFLEQNKSDNYDESGHNYVVYVFSESFMDELDKIYRLVLKRQRAQISKYNRNLDMLYCVGIHTNEDIEEIYDAQEGLCYFSRVALTKNPKNYSIEHLNPISKDGTDWPKNIALVEKNVNRKKHNKSLSLFNREFHRDMGLDEKNELKSWQKEVSKKRNSVNRRRVAATTSLYEEINFSLKEIFGDHIDYRLDVRTGLELGNAYRGWIVDFPGGFIRNKKSRNISYLSSVVESLGV